MSNFVRLLYKVWNFDHTNNILRFKSFQFQLSEASVTFKMGQSHRNWYKRIKFRPNKYDRLAKNDSYGLSNVREKRDDPRMDAHTPRVAMHLTAILMSLEACNCWIEISQFGLART